MTKFAQFKYVFQWQLSKNADHLIFFAVIQIMVSLGIVVGFSYLYADPQPGALLYLATGAPTIILIMTGLVILPQMTATGKTEGYIEFIRTWPVSRGVIMAADSLVWLLVTIPGITLASVAAHLIFQPGYAVSWTIVPALLLTALASIGVGYGFSYGLPPAGSMALSQVLVFGALMFSPINFPMERLPEWLQTLHQVLPLYHMAEVVRSSMAGTTFSANLTSYLILAAWCIVGYFTSLKILNQN